MSRLIAVCKSLIGSVGGNRSISFSYTGLATFGGIQISTIDGKNIQVQS